MDFHPSRASYICNRLQLRHLVKVWGSSPGPCSMHSPHKYPPFSMLAWNPNLFFLNSLSQCINPPFPQPTHKTITSTLPYIEFLGNPVLLHPLHMVKPPENTFINPFIIPFNSLIHAFGTLSIFLIPNKPLRLSFYTAVTLDLSSFHNIISLPYVRTGTSNVSCKTSTLNLQIPRIN